MFQFFSWKSVPFVRFILPLIAGIVCSVFIGVSAPVYWVVMVFGAAGILITQVVRHLEWRSRLEYGMWLFRGPMLFGLGAYLVDVHQRIDQSAHFSNFSQAEIAQVVVLETPQAKAKSIKLVVEVEALAQDEIWYPVLGKLLLYLETDSLAANLEIGDVLLMPFAPKAVSPPANPGEFDYRRYLSFRDIHHQQYSKSLLWSQIDESWSPRKQAERWRSYLLARIGLIDMTDEERSIASALLLGKKDDLSPELQRSYASAGAMHVLAVSGLHVGIIYFILKSLLLILDRWKQLVLLKAALLIAGLWIYAFVTGLSPSVVRAATMFSAVTLAVGLGRRSSIYNTVASSAFILLLFDPFYIMQVGFQLSYLAVLGIIYLYDKIYDLIYVPQRLLDKLWQISAVSIAAQLVTFPLGLLYFHQFPTYFLLSNILVIPAAFVILYLGFAYLAASWVPFLGMVVGKLLAFVIALLNMAVLWVESLPSALISGIDISILDTWFIYLLLGCGVLALVYHKRWALQASLAICLLILGLQLRETMDFKRHPHLVVYDVRDKSVINLLSDEQNILLCDSLLAMDESKQQFHLRNNWNKHGAPEPDYVILEETQPASPLRYFSGHSILHLDERSDQQVLEGGVSVDYLILSYFKGMDMKEILNRVEAKQIILDATIRGRSVKHICGEAPGSAIHVIAEEGYFSTRL